MQDCGFTRENKWFRYRAAAIIIEEDCVLFAGNEIDDYYYSIGGGVHVGETSVIFLSAATTAGWRIDLRDRTVDCTRAFAVRSFQRKFRRTHVLS